LAHPKEEEMYYVGIIFMTAGMEMNKMMNPYFKRNLNKPHWKALIWLMAIVVGLLFVVSGSKVLPATLRCSEDAIICCRILEREGYTARVAWGDWLGKGYPHGTDHAQCFTITIDNGKVWWVLVNNEPVKTLKHNFRIDHEVTWQEAVKLWWK
jgi:hypothetical protein